MRVIDVETFVVDADWRNWFFVQVKTDEGITGVGEALSGEGLTAALEATADAHKHYLIGEDPLNRKQISRKLRRYPFAWRAGKLINAVASAFDIALWDIAGKYYGEPVWKLLGGKVHDEIPVYANGWHIGERTPENYAYHAKKAVEEQGYPALKCDPFAHYEYSLTDDQIDEVAELLEAVREAVGWNVGIALDCHGRFSRRGAIEVANALEEYDIMFLEEPVELEDRDVMADVTQHVNMPVATGERIYNNETMEEIVRKQACDIVQPDLTNYGSLQELQHAAAIAKSRYMTFAPHNPNAGVSTAAGLHLCAGVENLEVLEHMSRDVEWGDEIVKHDFEVEDGAIEVPDKPGLGVEFDAEVARKYPGEPKDSHSLFDKDGALKRP
ncbi:mandelate racemase/muconate lactonizing enzyme family protein [Natronorubrum bangense]|uniref:Mandelate racemase/muconate lactonizing protein n=2 Tax=Natronorubrum bangense TaxID=61858 RepID=L9WIB1_9EURY|nr:mandelate racemase/muconate lactonizing enzyme family protein [Natronorubrum bangense]ELY49102.1 mandelate racemase/muconate lactonizing protein [Natronorubrum bangense JCM 10635]QCC57010.1 mandelate racemase/muconate lactonizing enzyme family protein [Natronorubrum bangense]